jgi:hypothetical protein
VASLEENRALCKKWVALYETQAAQLTAVRVENAQLWKALSAPVELQPYIAVGCSTAEAQVLAREAPRGT